jgi:glycosyltransferase involved in cell wall biosynthesis
MYINKVFILVPAAVLDSPVKGAAALANALVQEFTVTFVAIKGDFTHFNLLNKSVNVIALESFGSLLKRFFALRRMLSDSGGRESVACISSCLSADFFNSCCCDVALTCSSVRGNLPEVYPGTYGIVGRWLAYLHLNRLTKVDHVISMTSSMSNMVERYIGRPSQVIGNFIDENPLDKYRRTATNTGDYKFVYTGSLINGKKPGLLVSAIADLIARGIKAKLDIFGDGPLLIQLKEQAKQLDIFNDVVFHGFVNKPFKCVAEADVLVLPSLSEGVSRSVLEGLYLGVPCVLRDTDGNSEVITSGVNGELFRDESNLADIMLRVAERSRSENLFREILSPTIFRQQTAVEQYIKILTAC